MPSKHEGSVSTAPMAARIASCGGDDTWQIMHETTSCSNANACQHQVQVILLLAALGEFWRIDDTAHVRCFHSSIRTPYQDTSASLRDNVELGAFVSLFNRLLPNLPEAARTSRNLQALAIKMASLLFALVPATCLQSYSINSSRLRLCTRKNDLKSSCYGRQLLRRNTFDKNISKLRLDSRHGLPWKKSEKG